MIGGCGALSRFLSKSALLLSGSGCFSPLLRCPLGQAMEGARSTTVHDSGIPLQGSPHPHPSPAPALPGSYLREIKRTKGEGVELEPGTLVQDPLCSVGFRVRGNTPEWDLKLMSKSLSKGCFQPTLSIVSLTARCRPPLTPPCVMGRGTGPPPRKKGTTGTRRFIGLWGIHCTQFPQEGRAGFQWVPCSPQTSSSFSFILLLPALCTPSPPLLPTCCVSALLAPNI